MTTASLFFPHYFQYHVHSNLSESWPLRDSDSYETASPLLNRIRMSSVSRPPALHCHSYTET